MCQPCAFPYTSSYKPDTSHIIQPRNLLTQPFPTSSVRNTIPQLIRHRNQKSRVQNIPARNPPRQKASSHDAAPHVRFTLPAKSGICSHVEPSKTGFFASSFASKTKHELCARESHARAVWRMKNILCKALESACDT